MDYGKWCAIFSNKFVILFVQAGDLFSVSDNAIANDLTEVILTITKISTMPDYLNNNNDQSVVEICVTRVTSAIRYI
jgi:protein melted